jgi:hypothetical protein
MLDTITVIAHSATSSTQRMALIDQATMAMRSAEASVVEGNDLRDIRRRFAFAASALLDAHDS